MIRAIDKDILIQEIATEVVEGRDERYQFTWPNKREAILAANAPLSKTLRPAREESVNFDETENLYIEGDNLEVLKLLQETYLGKIKMIYIDPPYNTGSNLIYKNDFTQSHEDYISNSNQFDEYGNRLEKNLNTNGRFHTDWLNMIYPRLKLAKQLLHEDGVIACAIDENEFGSLSLVLKEIFNERSFEHNYITIVHNPRGQQGLNFSYVNEYLIVIYPKNGKKYLADFSKKEVDARNLRDSGSGSDRVNAKNCFYPFLVKDQKIIGIGDIPKENYHPSSANVFHENGVIEIWPLNEKGEEKKWRYARQTVEGILDKLEVKKGRTSFQVIYNKADETIRSVWNDSRYDASEYGSKLVRDLFGTSTFTYPKSLWAVYDIIYAVTKEDDDAIILDFFSGSATTAHATMEINYRLGGSRKYIMVQIPENLKESLKGANSKERKEIQNSIDFLEEINKPSLLSELGKERLRRSGSNLMKQNLNKENIKNLDIGFRVLKTDSSNMKDVYYAPDKTEQSFLDSLENNIKEDRSPEDLLFQVMLDLGIPLSAGIQVETMGGKDVFVVEEGFLIACFDEDMGEDVVKAIAEKRPYYAVFRDASMAGDSVATNFDQIFESISPETVRRVL